MAKDIDVLRAFYERRHPQYEALIGHWLFLEATYHGGRDWFGSNIFKYHKEGDVEFSKRLGRAYRFNHTKEAVDLVQKYLFKAAVTRNTTDASEAITEFWKKATLNGLDIDQFMRGGSIENSIGGRIAIVVDNNYKPPEVVLEAAEGSEKTKARPLSVKEARDTNRRIYAYIVQTKDILDYAFDEDGDGGLLWIKLRERVRDDKDPINSSGDTVYRVRLWTRTGWELYEDIETPLDRKNFRMVDGKRVAKRQVKLIDSGTHNLGVVPVVLCDHTISADDYNVPGLIDDIAYLDRAVANYLSNLDAIIQDQTFSQLAIPAQSLMPGDDAYDKVLELGTKRVFVFDGGAGSQAVPVYISPDPKQAQIILLVIAKIINEIYHTIGLAGERTKEDNSQGIDNSSGVAKAYDFERVNSLLLAKAAALQKAENAVVELVARWAGEEPPKENLVAYPTTFDVMRLADELVTAEALAKINAPLEVRRSQMWQVVEKLFPRLSTELKTKLRADVDKWLEGMDELLAPPTSFGGAKPVAAPSRQGSVTKDTPKK